MPFCSKCDRELPESSFGWRKAQNKPREWCKECAKEYGRRRYKEIKDQGGVPKRDHPATKVCKVCERRLPIKKFQYEPLRDLYDTTCNHCKYEKQEKVYKLAEKKEMFAKGLKMCSKCQQWLPKEKIPSGTYVGICVTCGRQGRIDKQSASTRARMAHIEENKQLLLSHQKRCIQCKTIKPLDDFGVHIISNKGTPKWYPMCNQCRAPKSDKIKADNALLAEGFIICTKCGEKLPKSSFPKKKNRKQESKGCYQSMCRKCHRQYYVKKYKDKERQHRIKNFNVKILSILNADVVCPVCGETKDIHNYPFEYVYNNKPIPCYSCRKDHTYQKKKAQKKRQRQNNPRPKEKNLKTKIREKIRTYLKSNKSHRMHEYIGCSYPELRTWLESQFTEGMSWDNYGEWHIDHYVPLAYFNADDEKDALIAWHYLNLRPLWAEDNLLKADELPDDYLEHLEKIKKTRESS